MPSQSQFKQQLLKHLFNTGSIMFSDEGFVTKSGKKYFFETDIRNGLKTSVQAMRFAKIVYALVRNRITHDTVIVGVPETGTLVSSLLLTERLKHTKVEVPINMMRAQPKGYQKETTYTVLPMKPRQRVLVIEDDVVTGATMLEYVRQLRELGLRDVIVVSVIDRNETVDGKTVGSRVEELGFAYIYLLGMDDLLAFARQSGISFPSHTPIA